MKRTRYLMFLLALLMTIPAMAQKQLFTGVVKDALGEPVIGASVVEKGSSNGSVTDLDGKFSVSTIPGTTLVVSYVGYKSQEVKAKENMNITLQEDAQVLDNVVVIGYGVQKKSVVTASIAKVSSDDLEGKTRLRADDALKGMAAGVNVTSASGQPGSKSMIRVRGIGTINNSEPLYIIDGMPTDQDGMESVNPADIESIEVLKDAASGAIYGARAANGVILVTTKRGKEMKPEVSFTGNFMWGSATRKPKYLNSYDSVTLLEEALKNDGMPSQYSSADI